MDKLISELILELHFGSKTVSIPEFKGWALDTIQKAISFDSAIWVYGYIEDKKFVSKDVYSYKQPAELYELRHEYKEYSTLLNRMLIEPGITLTRDMAFPNENFKDFKIYKEYFSKYDMEHALGTMKIRKDAGLCSHIAVYRCADQPAFNENDRRNKEALLLHLIESYKYCLFNFCIDSRYIDSKKIGKIICDKNGMMIEASDGVARQLQKLWPDWSGSQLPQEFVELSEGDDKKFGDLRVKVNAFDDLKGIELHPQN